VDGLKRRAVISLASSYISQFLTTAAEFVSKIVLARLIVPAQWGVFAEAMLVILAADVFTDLGLSQHIAREKKRPFGNVLLIRAALSALAIGVLELLAPQLRFFTPAVIGPARALAPIVLIRAVGSVPTVFVDRELMVHRSLAPQFTRLSVMAGISIGLAWAGYGVWALVAGTLCSETAYTALMWLSVRRLLALDLTLKHTRALLTGSRYLFFIAIVGLLSQQGDILVTGTLLSPKIVGLYAMAVTLVQRVSKVVETAVYRVIYPMFCEVADDIEKLGRIYRFTTLAITAIETPIYFFLLFHSGFFVSALLGPKWMPMARILQALAMAGVSNPYATFGMEVLRATKQDRMLAVTFVSSTFVLVGGGLLLTLHFGVMGMVAANYMAVSGILCAIALLRTIRQQFLDLTRKLVVVYLVSFVVSAGAFVLVRGGLARPLAGMAAVPMLWALFFRLYGIHLGKETLKSL